MLLAFSSGCQLCGVDVLFGRGGEQVGAWLEKCEYALEALAR